MSWLRLVAAAAALCLPLSAAVANVTKESPRAAIHDGFGRMVFDWPEAVEYSAEAADDTLVVRFDRPLTGNPRKIIRPLAPYVRNVDVSADRKTLTFALARPAKVRTFVTGQSVVVDLLDTGGKAAAATAPAAAAPNVAIRGSAHADFHRVVLSWPRTVKYTAERLNETQVAVRFAARGRIDTAALQAVLPKGSAVVGIDEQAAATTVTLGMPAGARLRHLRRGRDVILDVLPPPPSAAPEQAAAPQAPSAPEAPQPTPLVPEQTAVPETPPPSPPAVAEPAPAVAEEDMRPAEPVPPVEQSYTLTFPMNEPAAAAVFRRAGWLWVVFDKPVTVNLEAIHRDTGDAVAHIEQLPRADLTALRMIAPPSYNPSLRRDGLAWIVDLTHQPMHPATPIEVRKSLAGGHLGLFLPVAEGGPALKVVDPEVGDELTIVPVTPLGSGVYPGTELAELEVLPTAQGIVVVPRADGLTVQSSRTGVTIGVPGGLSIGAALGDVALAGGQDGGSGALDVTAWLRTPHQLQTEAAGIRQGISELPRGNRNPLRLQLARLMLANGHHPEALAILRVMLDDEPALAEAAAFRVLRGAARFLMYRPEEAIDDFSHQDLLADPTVAPWRAAAMVAMEEAAAQAPTFETALPLIAKYPPYLKRRLGFAAAESLIAAGAEKPAAKVLGLLEEQRLTRSQTDRLAYYRGAYEELAGNFGEAIRQWEQAEAGNDRWFRARAALARILLELKTDVITGEQAVARMNQLRFAWRGDEFEYELMRRLGTLQIELGDVAEGLRTLRQLVGNFGQHKDVQQVTRTMADAFERLFLNGQADTLSPIAAIALFDEFRELTPAGDEGEEMIRRLADRLVAMDLLDRAAELLQHQVDYRLSGAAKARVAARLALVRLLNHQPAAALRAIDGSDAPDLPPELELQRRHLAAQALSDLGRGPEAIARLKGDGSTGANLLRAEIEWRQQNWKETARAFAALVVKPAAGKPLDPTSARFVLHWATALTLAGDEAGVTHLREGYGTLMTATPYADAFTLVTSNNGGQFGYRTVADKIEMAEKFQAFMAAYRQRLRSEGLSAIN